MSSNRQLYDLPYECKYCSFTTSYTNHVHNQNHAEDHAFDVQVCLNFQPNVHTVISALCLTQPRLRSFKKMEIIQRMDVNGAATRVQLMITQQLDRGGNVICAHEFLGRSEKL